ncbi:MAG TPA: MarR family transcriptional regulator [Acidimicrobiales bacterium]
MTTRPTRTATSLDPVEVASHLRISTARLTRTLRQNDDSGLGPTVIAALATVAREGPLTLGELAAAEQVAPPTITKIANKLVERGFVSREVDPDDRRVVRLEVTEAGRKQLDTYRKRRTTWLAARLRNCTPDELATLDEAARIIDRLTGGTGEVR